LSAVESRLNESHGISMGIFCFYIQEHNEMISLIIALQDVLHSYIAPFTARIYIG